MFRIKIKKMLIVSMLITFVSSMITPAFAITQNNVKLRTGTQKTSTTQKIPPNAVKLVGDVNLKHGNQLVSVSLRDSDVKQVLRMFADKAGLNIVFHSSVEGNVTLDLVNVTLNNAFKMIMEASELAYYIENDTLIVTSKEADKTVGLSKSNMMVIPVKYVDATAMATFLNKNIFSTGRTGLSNGDIAVTNPRTNEIIIFGSYNDYRVAKEVIEKVDTKPSIATFKVNHVTPKEMANLICNTIFATNDDETTDEDDDSDTEIEDQDTSLGSAGQSSSSSSSSLKNIKLGSGQVACKLTTEWESDTLQGLNTNSVIVLYYPELGNVGIVGGSVEQIQLVEEFIKSNDKKQPQAYVELQIVGLNEEGSKQFSNDWQILSPFFSASFDSSTGTLQTNPLNPTFWAGNGYDVYKTSSGIPTYQYSVTKMSGPTTITQSITYLIKNQKGRVLANPKVVVTNGRVSTIDLSSDYIKKVTSQVLAGVTAGATQKDYTIGDDNGMTIQLVPFISADGYVAMNIKPSYSTIKSQEYTTSEAGTQDIAATLLQRRNLNLSNVRIKDGETLVLGGLIQDVETKTVTKMPILGDIPVLGMFFRGSTTAHTKEELVILITPHIIKDTEDVKKTTDVVDL